MFVGYRQGKTNQRAVKY